MVTRVQACFVAFVIMPDPLLRFWTLPTLRQNTVHLRLTHFLQPGDETSMFRLSDADPFFEDDIIYLHRHENFKISCRFCFYHTYDALSSSSPDI
jgi:hypothetical protein